MYPLAVLQIETVLLDGMTGFEFEEFFGHLLTKLSIGQVEKVLFTQDEGRDILVRTPTGLLVVECKHHPNGSIGRPIVQKLHSAVISSGAVRGILVTTGHFTKEALAYAQKIHPPVEMIDRALLTEMASRASIKMVSGGQSLNIWTLSIPKEASTKVALGEYLKTTLDSYPRDLGLILVDIHRKVRHRPVYQVTYDVNAAFTTSIGLIHREHARQAKIVIDGGTGELLDKAVSDFMIPEPQIQLLGMPEEASSEPPNFRLDAMTARTRAKKMISQIHTRTKTYRGRNNQRYQKICEPNDRDIVVTDIRQVQLPSLDLTFKLLETDYRASILQGLSGRLLDRGNNVMNCRICSSPVKGRALVCDTCGRTTHRKRFLAGRSHGFECQKCKRTTCRFDGRWSFRWLIFTRLLCHECGAEATRKGLKVYKFKPLPSLQKGT